MNLENFPMDVQRCPLKLGSCEFDYQTQIYIILWVLHPQQLATQQVMFSIDGIRGQSQFQKI